MDSSRVSYVREIRRPVRLVDIMPGGSQQPTSQEFSTVEALTSYLDDAGSGEQTYRYMFVEATSGQRRDAHDSQINLPGEFLETSTGHEANA